MLDYWPACSVCATPIRHNVDGPPRYDGRPAPGMWRECGCPGVLWESTMTGWQKWTDVPAGAP